MNELRGLWRGKTTPKTNGDEFNGVWVEGDLIRSENRYYIHPVANAVKVQSELGKLIIMHQVDPSTLGECTGLRDKNGTLIFEGDIIKTGNVRFIDDNDWKGNVGIVEWWNEPASFIITNGTNSIYFLNHVSADDCEVIDNIHDNLKHLID